MSRKRVSFGGENINFFNSNEFSSPEDQPPPSKSVKPAGASSPNPNLGGPRMFPSPLPPRRGVNSKLPSPFRDPHEDGLDDIEDDDDHGLSPGPPPLRRLPPVSPSLSDAIKSPMPDDYDLSETLDLRTSFGRPATSRQSYGLFRDEDAMPEAAAAAALQRANPRPASRVSDWTGHVPSLLPSDAGEADAAVDDDITIQVDSLVEFDEQTLQHSGDARTAAGMPSPIPAAGADHIGDDDEDDDGDDGPTLMFDCPEDMRTMIESASRASPAPRSKPSPSPRRASIAPSPRRASIAPSPRRASVAPSPHRASIAPSPQQAVKIGADFDKNDEGDEEEDGGIPDDDTCQTLPKFTYPAPPSQSRAPNTGSSIKVPHGNQLIDLAGSPHVETSATRSTSTTPRVLFDSEAPDDDETLHWPNNQSAANGQGQPIQEAVEAAVAAAAREVTVEGDGLREVDDGVFEDAVGEVVPTETPRQESEERVEQENLPRPEGMVLTMPNMPNNPHATVPAPSAPVQPQNACEAVGIAGPSAARPPVPPSATKKRGGGGSMKAFLKGLTELSVHFDDFSGSGSGTREVSLPPPDPDAAVLDGSSIAGRVLRGAQKQAVLDVVNEQIVNIRERIDRREEEIGELVATLEKEGSPVFRDVCNLSSLSNFQRTKMSLSLKRLRLVSLMQAKEHWVKKRMEWEREILSRLEDVEGGLADDVDGIDMGRVELDKVIEENGVGRSEDNEEYASDNEDIVVRQRQLVQEASIVADLRKQAASLHDEEGELQARVEGHRQTKKRLLEKIKMEEPFAGADTFEKLRKLFKEKTELNEISYGLTGVTPVRFSRNEVSVRIGGLVDVQWMLHEKRIINKRCGLVPQNADHNEMCKEYCKAASLGAIKWSRAKELCRSQEMVKSVRVMRGILLRARLVMADVIAFLRRNEGEVVYGGVGREGGSGDMEDGEVVGELEVTAVLFCMKRRCKFEVRMQHRVRVREGGKVGEEVEVVAVSNQFGAAPSDEEIRGAVERWAARRGDKGVRVGMAFAEVWGALELDDGAEEVDKMIGKVSTQAGVGVGEAVR